MLTKTEIKLTISSLVREESSVSMPIDLIIEILSRLPVKSIARFHCLSKLCESMLVTPCFIELFLTRSSARPRLLLVVGGFDDCRVMTTPQPHYNPYNKSSSSLVLTTDFLKKLPHYIGSTLNDLCLTAGLISSYIRPHGLKQNRSTMIYNPSTGHHTMLYIPNLSIRYESRSFLGFDPINKQYKVLSINYSWNSNKETYHIITLGAQNGTWRKIHCPLRGIHPKDEGICIDGVLYYSTDTLSMIVCFDVKSEVFKFTVTDFIRDDWERDHTKLINYKGKIGVITLHHKYSSLELCVWVIMDVERQEWSKLYEYTFWENRVVESDFSTYWEDQVVRNYVSVVGVTATGEFFLSHNEASKPLIVFCFNPERNNRQIVEIQGFDKHSTRVIKVFVDHVENLGVIDMMKTVNAAPSSMIKPTEQKCEITSTSSRTPLQQDRRPTVESINKFNLLSLLDDDDED